MPPGRDSWRTMVDATARSMNDGRQTSSNQLCRPTFEVTLLGQARRASGRLQVCGARGALIPRQLQQMTAHRHEPVALGERPSSVASNASPACGPSTIASATAWLSVTIGLGAIRSSSR